MRLAKKNRRENRSIPPSSKLTLFTVYEFRKRKTRIQFFLALPSLARCNGRKTATCPPAFYYQQDDFILNEHLGEHILCLCMHAHRSGYALVAIKLRYRSKKKVNQPNKSMMYVWPFWVVATATKPHGHNLHTIYFHLMRGCSNTHLAS